MERERERRREGGGEGERENIVDAGDARQNTCGYEGSVRDWMRECENKE